MKQPKWWIIGLGAILLAVCIWECHWSQRLPYAFMNGAQLLVVEYDPLPPKTGVYSELFVVERPYSRVSQAAVRELGFPQFNWEEDMEFLHREPQPDVFIEKLASEGNPFAVYAPSAPRTTKTLITICYPRHSLFTRMRAWLQNFGSRRSGN